MSSLNMADIVAHNHMMNNTFTTLKTSTNAKKIQQSVKRDEPSIRSEQKKPQVMAHNEDLSQRKTFSIISKKSKKESNKNPINWETNDPEAGKIVSLTASPTKLPPSPKKEPQQAVQVVKETDDYEEDQEDMESSMKDSQAQQSDDYSQDHDFDAEVVKRTKNAEEYFKELEDAKSRETPEGM